jgi:acyl dehydratase
VTADSSLVGKELQTITFRLDPSKLAELARSLFDDDPVYYDVEAARAAGFAEVPIPLLTTVLVNHWEERGVEGVIEDMGLDLARSVHGEVAWELVKPMHVGDVLTARRRVKSVSRRQGRRGGAMTLVELETLVTNADGELVVRRTDTMIERET